MKKTLAIIFSLFSLSSYAADCSEALTMTEMKICSDEEYKKADQRLNKIYSAYRSTLDNQRKEAIKNIQLAWIKYRDLSCEYAALGGKGGSIYSYIISLCLIDMTNQRIKDLEKLSSCEEGDLSCP
jgi:uncharacterized protein YecT (DUF1311 family)